MNYVKNNPPKLGVVANSIRVFSEEGKQAAETQLRNFFEKMKRENVIHPESVFYPQRIFSPPEAAVVAERFSRERIDGMIVLDSAFPNGNTFLRLALDSYLRNLPLVILAPSEYESPEKHWTTNAYCGLIMNNFAARRTGRPVFPVAGWPSDPACQEDLRRIIAVIRTVASLRSEFVCRFGEAPGGFHSADVDKLTWANRFGVHVDTMDLSAVMAAMQSGCANGYLGETSFTERDAETTSENMIAGKKVSVDREWVKSSARLFHAFKAVVDANGFTSAAVRCWPEIGQMQKISACLAISWLQSSGAVRAAACESDVSCAVAQSIGASLTGAPAGCMDFVNDLGASKIVQLGHCGFGVPGKMVKCELGPISPDAQAGCPIGPACLGQYEYGPKTGFSLLQDGEKFKMLVFTGQSSPETDRGLRYAASDVEVKNPRRLNELVLEHGFSHHLAMAFGDASRELKLLCDFYGMEYYNPDC